MFGGSRGSVTGLDVGTESVKAIRLQHTAGRARVVGIALAEIEYPSAIRGESDPDARAARVTAIKNALKTSGTEISPHCMVITAVEGPGVSVKHVTFPKMSNPNLAESIGWEAKKHVPFGGSEFVLDFQQLPRKTREESKEMHVLLAAVEQRQIDAHVELVSEAGIEPFVVDVVPLAIMNGLYEQGLVGEGAVAAVEMGAGTLSVSIYRAGGLLLARSVRMPTRAGAARGDTDEARQQWQTFVLKEVQRSLAFYNTETGRRGIDKIYLMGGRALTGGVADRFSEALKVDTAVFNPLEKMADSAVNLDELRSQGPKFALAMSLARRM